MNISYVKPSMLTPAPWRATHVLKPDLKILSESISDYGLLSPLVVQQSSGLVIDGYHRLLAISGSKELVKLHSSGVPCIAVNVDDIDAMVMHIRINRPKGSVVAKHMSSIVKQIYQSRKYTIDEIDDLFNMNVTESELMLDGSLIKMRKVKEHTYSPAWIPVEAPAGAVDSVVLERPPNDDR